jgi:hypothetical protein
MPDKYKPPYAFSVTIGETCARKMRTFVDLAEKLKMDAAVQRQGLAIKSFGQGLGEGAGD